MTLERLVRDAALRRPEAIAVVAGERAWSYAELDRQADLAAAGLHALGVRRGDRVALWDDKSARIVAAMQGALRLGAAYVPIDPQSPPARARLVFTDCEVRALVTSAARAGDLGEGVPPLLLTDESASGPALAWGSLPSLPAAPVRRADPDELAYILYTSGSTGRPKGVCISHENALAFVRWAARAVALGDADVLSNHAPFHFDLSVFDLYAAFARGARVCLVPEAAAYAPRRLVELMMREQISVWYSVPSALILMMEHGGLLEAPLPALRTIVFAGEVFPAKHLLRLRARMAPPVRLWNWYGPTETNVCTSYELGATLPLDATGAPAIPIGHAASDDRIWLRGDDGQPAVAGQSGELMVEGPTVMLGYWGQPPQSGAYATGDIARLDDEDYAYLGRRDHMLKVRGHRIEPAEIEAALLDHPDLREAAVVVAGAGVEARLMAFAALVPGARRPSLLALKERCARRLPRPMIIDEVRWLEALPRTSNGKIDRALLRTWTQPGGAR
jgi:amino acid adenylation domain-containing protein